MAEPIRIITRLPNPMEPPPLFARALARREPLRAGSVHGPTDALRLLDGAGDGPEFDGLTLDDFAGRWLVSTPSETGLNGADWLRAAAPGPVYWKQLDKHDKRPPTPWHGDSVPEPFPITENGLRYGVDFAAGYAQGIFLDQRDNRFTVRERCARLRAPTMLNLFAYTCAFSAAAAAGGAHVVSVDLSRASLERGRENFRLNGLDDTAHEFIAGDAEDWLRRFTRRGRHFDLIVLDPPSFSRDHRGKVFRLGRDLPDLVGLAAKLLPPKGNTGALLASTNLRALPPGGLRRLVRGGVTEAGSWWTREAPMPADFTGKPYLQTVWLEQG